MTTVEGFYSCYISGSEGNGFAMFVFDGGRIIGCDPLGVLFDGSYAVNNSQIDASVTVTVPQGGTVIQGASAGPTGLSYQTNFTLKADFDENDYFGITTPLGPVNVRLKKLRDMGG